MIISLMELLIPLLTGLITGLPNIRLKHLLSFLRTTDANDIMFRFIHAECEDCLQADILIFNNFEELEHDAIQTVKHKYNYSNIYSIGPLSLLEQKYVARILSDSLNSSWKQEQIVFDWLDNKELESLLYINYGCVANMSSKDFQELASGIANSKQPFLWVVRPDVVKDGPSILSEEYFEEVKNRRLIVSWCAQENVLGHPAVGAFLTHCGWNSMTETICGGVPVICWPFFGNLDVKRDEVSMLVEEMMVGERGKKMRMKAKDWKCKAEKATNVGGSSYNNLDKFIKDILASQN